MIRIISMFNCDRSPISVMLNRVYNCFTVYIYIYILPTNICVSFISVINQLDAQNFCFTISIFHASTCLEHMCSKHVEA